MPRVKLTKTVIDALPTPLSDVVYWDAALPGFGVKVTPKGRKVFIVLYRTGGAGSKLCKYTIGPYGRVTLHHARLAAQKVFAARLVGAIRRLRNERRNVGWRQIAWRICWRPLLTNGCPRPVLGLKLGGCFAERWERPGPAEASMRSANEMWWR